MLHDPFKFFLLVAFAATAAVWSILLLDRLSRRGGLSSRLAAKVALLFYGITGVSILALSPSVQSIYGSSATLTWQAVRASQVATAVTVVAALVAILGTKRPLGRGRPIVIALWAYAVIRTISGLVATPSSFSRTLLILALVVHAAVSTLSWQDVVSTGRWMLRLVTVPSAIGVVVAPSWALLASDGSRQLFGLDRLVGLSPHPNTLAGVAAIALLLECNGRVRDRWQYIGGVAAAVCVLLTQSHTMWVAVCIALLIAALRRPALRIAVLAAIIFTATFAAARPNAFSGSGDLATFNGRTQIWRIAVQAFNDHLLIGVGPGFLGPTDPHYSLTGTSLQFASHAHNQIVQTAAEMGVPGVLALAALWIVALTAAFRGHDLAGGLPLALLTLHLFDSITEVPLRATTIDGPALAVLFGVLACAARSPELSNPEPALDREEGADDPRLRGRGEKANRARLVVGRT